MWFIKNNLISSNLSLIIAIEPFLSNIQQMGNTILKHYSDIQKYYDFFYKYFALEKNIMFKK